MEVSVYGYINNPFNLDNCKELSDIAFDFNLADYIAEDIEGRDMDYLMDDIEDVLLEKGLDEDERYAVLDSLVDEIIDIVKSGDDSKSGGLSFSYADNGYDGGYDYSFYVDVDIDEIIEKTLSDHSLTAEHKEPKKKDKGNER